MNFFNTLKSEKAVIYIRVSTEKQAKEGHGLEGQEEECMKKIKKEDWKYVKTYIDKAISGTKGTAEREGIRNLLEDAKEGLFDIVVIYKLDRLGRTSTMVVETVKYIVDELGLTLFSCREDIDTSKPSGRFSLNMFAGIAEYEKDTIVERLTMGRDHVLKTKGETGGLLCYGYIREEGKTIGIVQEKAEIVRKVIMDYENGISMEQIARDLNDKQIPAAKGGRWNGTSIRKILSNREKYEGCIRSGKNIKNEKWPTIYKDNFTDVKKYLTESKIIDEIMNKTRRTGIYIRIANSSNKNYKYIQEEETRKYLEEKNLYLTQTYYETSPSEKIQRKELEQLYKDIKAKKFGLLIVYRLNILAHNEKLLKKICDELRDKNIGIISILGN